MGEDFDCTWYVLLEVVKPAGKGMTAIDRDGDDAVVGDDPTLIHRVGMVEQRNRAGSVLTDE